MPAHPLDIPKTKLERLYLKKLLSTDAIAIIFHCNHVTILNYLKKYHIPRRSRLGTRKPIIVSKETLHRLYHKQHLTQKQIANQLGHSRYGMQRWMKIYGIKSRSDFESHTKYKKTNYDGDNAEKAYLIGFRLGDLNVMRIHELIQVRCSTTINSQVVLIRNLFKKYGNVHVWKAKRGTYEIVVLLNNTFSFLLPKQDDVESWITRTQRYFLAFLAGYSDAEGSIFIRKSSQGNKLPYAGFEIASYDKKVLQKIGIFLREHGLVFPTPNISTKAGYYRRGIKRNKDCWRISIYQKESLWRLLHWLQPFMKHKTKLASLQEAKKNIQKRNSLPYSKPIQLVIPAPL